VPDSRPARFLCEGAGEGLGFTANVGIASEPSAGSSSASAGLLTGLGVKPALEIAMWVLVVLALITIWQRAVSSIKQHKAVVPEELRESGRAGLRAASVR